MSDSKKVPNWSADQISAIEDQFSAHGRINNETVKVMQKTELFAAKSVNMLRSKIVNAGYYQVAEKSSAPAKDAPTRKIAFVKAIEVLTGCKDLGTLEKASKPQLQALSEALTTLSAQYNADNGDQE